jgi:hypothetical protein
MILITIVLFIISYVLSFAQHPNSIWGTSLRSN